MSDKVRNIDLAGHVGFDNLPDQLVTKALQKGFVFNILCIGETGIGKSTLMDSLFNTSFEEAVRTSHNLISVELKPESYELQENNVQMKLTIVNTVGYGDQINKGNSFKSIVDYIDQQFEAYLQEELKIERCLLEYHDTRVHSCLYFICPTGHGLKSIDLMCMKQLDSKVNIIPVIAKADTISKNELLTFKETIMSELNANGVKIYQPPPMDDDSVPVSNTSVNIPFAVVGSTEFAKVGNKMVRARQYPWGTVLVEDDTHCDFVKLREMLIRTNMEDMREATHTNHYELYRKTRLEKMDFSDVDSNNQPTSFQQTCEKKMYMQRVELAQKEKETKRKLMQRVKDTEDELNETERQLYAKFDQAKEENTKEKNRMEDYQKQLDAEISQFELITIQHQTAQLLSSSRRHTLSLGSLKGKKNKPKMDKSK